MTIQYGNPAAPANQAAVIVPSDTVNIPTGPTRGIFVGVAGNITAVFSAPGEVAVLLKNVPVGEHPWSVIRINATATAATDMVALY